MIRPLKLSIFGVLGFLGFILGETLKKEFISFFLCGILSINSVTCYTGVKASAASSQGRTDINAIAAVDADGLESDILELENSPSPEIAIPPMIRPPQVDLDLQEALPQDFQITQQMPYSSGRRDIVMVSRSTGAEQVYTVNLPGASNFQLYQVEYRNVSAIDFSQLSGSERIIVDTSEIQTVLNRFKIGFNNNRLSQVVLADGRMAEFSRGQAIIRSPEGEQIETIQLYRVDGEETIGMRSRKELSDRGNTKDELLLAQSSCQTNVSSSLNTVASQMTRYGNKLASSRSDLTQPLGWALAFGSGTLQTNINSRNPQLQEVTCRPPVQCEERRVNGASEVRTDLFQVARGGASQEVTLEYEFFDIPDRLELSYDGKQIFAIGPASGPGRETFSLPGTADFVGVKLIGNSNPQTKWWYTISCPQFTPIPEPPIVGQKPPIYPQSSDEQNSDEQNSDELERDDQGRKLLKAGIWNSNSQLDVSGGQGMHFVLQNINAIGTSIRIDSVLESLDGLPRREDSKGLILPPYTTMHITFARFGNEPMGWKFRIFTSHDVFLVTWKLYSTWIPGDPPNPNFPKTIKKS